VLNFAVLTFRKLASFYCCAFLFTNILATGTSIPQVSLQMQMSNIPCSE